MEKSNLENLNKLAKLFGTDRLISPEEVQEIRGVLVGVLANNKKELESLTAETRELVNKVLNKVLDEHDTYLEKSKQIAQQAKSDTTEAIQATMKSLEEVKNLCKEVMDCKPENGKDADEEYVISEVLNRIKLPEYKEVVLDDGLAIVDKINSLPVNEENQIDAKHIKNLPETKTRTISGGVTRKIVEQMIAAAGGGGTPGGSDTQVQYNNAGAFGGISGATTDGTAVTYTSGNLIAADVTASGSGGFLIQANNGTDVGLFGAGGGAGATFYGGVNITGDLVVDTNVLDVDTTNNQVGIGTTSMTSGKKLTIAEGTMSANQQGGIDITGNIGSNVGGNGLSMTLTNTTATNTGFLRLDRTASSAFVGMTLSSTSRDGIRVLTHSSTPVEIARFASTFAKSSGTDIAFQITPAINQSSTAGYTGLLVNSTETTTGSGTKLLADFQVGGTSKFSVDNIGKIIFTGGFATSTTDANSNLYMPSGSSGVGVTTSQIQIGGASTTTVRLMMRGSTAPTLGANVSYANFVMGTEAVTEGSSGTHPLIAGMALKPVAITNGTATSTNGATLYIEGAATGTTPTNNYALWVDDGTSVFDGAVICTDNAITATANAATIPVTARQHTVTNNSAAALTITFTTSGATNGQLQLVRIYDFSAVAQTLTFVNTENSDVSVPATTNGSTTLPRTVAFQYNSATTKWRCISNV